MRFSNEDSGNIPSFETLQTPKLLLSFETKLQLRHMNYHKYKQQLPCFALSNDWKKKKKRNRMGIFIFQYFFGATTTPSTNSQFFSVAIMLQVTVTLQTPQQIQLKHSSEAAILLSNHFPSLSLCCCFFWGKSIFIRCQRILYIHCSSHPVTCGCVLALVLLPPQQF